MCVCVCVYACIFQYIHIYINNIYIFLNQSSVDGHGFFHVLFACFFLLFNAALGDLKLHFGPCHVSPGHASCGSEWPHEGGAV